MNVGEPAWQEMAVVGRVARPHGNRGHVIIDPETDFPKERFKTGSVLFCRRDDRTDALTITAARFQRGRPIVGFEGMSSIGAAEDLGTAELRVPIETLQSLPVGTFYQHDLIGCSVTTPAGRAIGRVIAVEGRGTESRLVVSGAGEEILIPLAEEICVEVDVTGRRIVVQPPDGLLELNASTGKRSGRRRI